MPVGADLVHSLDCGQADEIAPLIRAGDTLLTEVSFGPGPVPAGVRHLDVPAVGMSRLLDKLGAHTRSEAVAVARRRGVLA